MGSEFLVVVEKKKSISISYTAIAFLATNESRRYGKTIMYLFIHQKREFL